MRLEGIVKYPTCGKSVHHSRHPQRSHQQSRTMGVDGSSERSNQTSESSSLHLCRLRLGQWAISTCFTTFRPLYIHNILCTNTPLQSPGVYTVYSLTWFDISTSGVSALQVRTLVLYSEANARVIPLEAYALLFRATRDMSSLIVPRS